MPEREIPHDIEAEKAVIGSLLVDGSLIERVDGLDPSDFYHEPLRLCFAACRELYEHNTAINQVTLARTLKEKGQLDAVGGPAYLSGLIVELPTHLDCEVYAAIVQRLAVSRKMIEAGERIASYGYECDPDIGKSLSKADSLLMEMRKKGLPPPIISPPELANRLAVRYASLCARNEIAVSTGLKDLDTALGGGFFSGEMIVIAARPGLGKTTFTADIARKASATQKVLFCSAEMGLDSLGDREIAAAVGATTHTIRRGGYDDKTYELISNGLPKLLLQQIYYYYEHPITTDKIFQAALQMQIRFGLNLIIVDYLGLLDDTYGRSTYERIGYISRRLKHIAMTLNVPLIAIHQLNRAVEMRAKDDRRPEMSDLRDSGTIEQDADVVLLLYRESYYNDQADDKAEVRIAKQRQGESHQIVKTYYDRLHQTYRDFREGV